MQTNHPTIKRLTKIWIRYKHYELLYFQPFRSDVTGKQYHTEKICNFKQIKHVSLYYKDRFADYWYIYLVHQKLGLSFWTDFHSSGLFCSRMAAKGKAATFHPGEREQLNRSSLTNCFDQQNYLSMEIWPQGEMFLLLTDFNLEEIINFQLRRT